MGKHALYLGLGLLAFVGGIGCNQGPIFRGDLELLTPDDLSGLDEVEEVEGSIIIEGSSLTDVTGLERIEWVGGALIIGGEVGNTSLASLEGLSGLQRVEGDVTIRRNPRLADLSGLRGLRSTGGSVVIQENQGLTSLGLTGYTTCDSFFTLDSNYALTSLAGLESLEYVDFTLAIDGNSAVTHLRALAGLRSVGRLFIRRNFSLPACAAEGLRDQIETYGGFTRYDMAVDVAENDPDGSCEAGPLG